MNDSGPAVDAFQKARRRFVSLVVRNDFLMSPEWFIGGCQELAVMADDAARESLVDPANEDSPLNLAAHVYRESAKEFRGMAEKTQESLRGFTEKEGGEHLSNE